MKKEPKKWYASWKFTLLIFLVALLLIWLLLPDEIMDGLSL